MQIQVVVLSGGSGSRLWPKSRRQYPKQFLPLVSSMTMLQETVGRIAGLSILPPIIVCNEDHRFLVAEQLQEVGVLNAKILLEPLGKNTAPAVAVAAMAVENRESILLVLAADHLIGEVETFQRLIRVGAKSAAEGKFVTFGIPPRKPETGYGYIKAEPEKGIDTYAIEAFVEKPDLETAERYLESGEYFWNSGMFMFPAQGILDEMGVLCPDIVDSCQTAYDKAEVDLDFIRLDREAFSNARSDSIDFAVMEKTNRAVVIPADIGWNDVGSWSSLWEVGNQDEEKNVLKGDVIATNSKSNYVDSKERLVALVGVENLVVIDTDDALLVASRDQVQDVKLVVDQLEADERSEFLNHRMVKRPWGSYDSIDADKGFQVKRITVNPEASLSLQMHHHRAEHWIVVEGTAEVTCGERVFLVEKNQSTYIPLGEKHRLRNPGKIPLKLIEVQSGDYLGEDDIVRFEDNYGRTESE